MKEFLKASSSIIYPKYTIQSNKKSDSVAVTEFKSNSSTDATNLVLNTKGNGTLIIMRLSPK